MQTTPSKFASWSLVASALILAAGIVTGAIILHASRSAPAALPHTSAEDQAERAASYLESALIHHEAGWRNRDIGMSLLNSTNRLAIGITNPAAQPTIRETMRQQIESGDRRYNLYFPHGTRPPE